eukprot:scaffold8938_cov110-Skeletonema_menzelii.AAC.1
MKPSKVPSSSPSISTEPSAIPSSPPSASKRPSIEPSLALSDQPSLSPSEQPIVTMETILQTSDRDCLGLEPH